MCFRYWNFYCVGRDWNEFNFPTNMSYFMSYFLNISDYVRRVVWGSNEIE